MGIWQLSQILVSGISWVGQAHIILQAEVIGVVCSQICAVLYAYHIYTIIGQPKA